MTFLTDCRGEKKSCGCTTAEACRCGARCACETSCSCGNGCACTSAK